jgi:hypothetical protein
MDSQNIPKDFFVNLVSKENSASVFMVWSYVLGFLSVAYITFSFYSDENLQNDHYLISLMDDQGWVPISIVADFKRVCFLCTNYLECYISAGALLRMQVCASLFPITTVRS